MATSEGGIIKMLSEKISEYEQKIQSLRDAMNALQSSESTAPAKSGKKRGRKPGSKNVSKAKANKPAATKKQRKPRSGETFEKTILKLLDDGTPKSARALLDLFNKSTGRKLEINGFSARLSIIKKNGSVMSIKNAKDGLSYFGKADWFAKGKFKPQYQSKMKG